MAGSSDNALVTVLAMLARGLSQLRRRRWGERRSAVEVIGVNGKQEGLESCWEGKVRRAEFSG